MGWEHKQGGIASIIAWIAFYLTVIDMAVNIVFPYPADPTNTHPNALQSYFEYGRSVEGKLERMTRRTNDESAPIISFGWLKNEAARSRDCRQVKTGETLVAVYGMSHTQMLGEAIPKVNGKYVIRSITAPGAVPTWTFTAYQLDTDGCRPDVAIFGVMTDAVPLLSATSGATAYFEMSYPYTFPRYVVQHETLHALYPPFVSVKEYRDFFYNSAKWAEYRTWLEQYDPFYDPLLFEMSQLDRSSLIRILRRAYFEFKRKEKVDTIYGKEGFNAKSDEVIVLRLIIKEFAKAAWKKNIIPIIYIVNNQGRGDHLYALLKPVLEADSIPFFSTHAVCPPDNPKLFLANSHFTPEKDLEIAREVIRIIKTEQNKLSNGSHRAAPRIPDNSTGAAARPDTR